MSCAFKFQFLVSNLISYSLSFYLQVIGKPTPKVTWMIDDNEIKDEPEYIIEVDETEGITTLTLPEVFPEDQATYTVKAENIAGEATSSATLLVEEGEIPFPMEFW